MKRNTITIIELIIVICVIVVAVRVWTYKNTHNKTFPTPVSVQQNISRMANEGGNKWYKCPRCGSSDLQPCVTNDGGITPTTYLCKNCGYNWDPNPRSKELQKEIERMVP